MISAFPKVRQGAYRLYTRGERKEHRLQYLFLELTRRCNLACGHCGSDCSRNSSMRELSTESWLSIVDALHDRYAPLFVLTGGEPLVRKDLFRITTRLAEKQARWGMVSNGFSLTGEKLGRLEDHGISAVTLSLDGPEESHRFIRRHRDSFSRALAAMDALGRSSIRYKDAVTCVFPGNLHRLEETAGILLDKGMTSWRLFRIFPKGQAEGKKELELSYQDSLRLVDWIRENRTRLGKLGLDVSFSCEGYLPFAVDRRVRREPFFCRSGISIAAILADGTITGCNNNGPEYNQGNLISDDFAHIWENGFQEYRDPSWRKTGVCQDCAEWEDCLGGSVHLRRKNALGPDFCYIHDLSKQ